MSGAIGVIWTREAIVTTPRGNVSSFRRNSYAAKLKYADGTAVIVVLPRGAARWPTAAWEPMVRKLADYCRRTTGSGTIEMTSPPYSPPPPA